MRGGREMDNHFEIMRSTFRDVPSIETPGVSGIWMNIIGSINTIKLFLMSCDCKLWSRCPYR